jgi:hypothetical protein
MRIPIVRAHIENQFKQFSSAYSTLCLEENRQPENIQVCKEKLHGLKTLIDTLDTKLEEELGERLK